MKSRYRAFEESAVYFVTSSIVDRYFEILIETLSFKRKNMDKKLYAYVFMDSHFHLILSAVKISKFMKEFKSFTARRIVDLLKENREMRILEQLRTKKKSHKTDSDYQIWQEGFHPQQILGEEMLIQKIEYIHQNPVRSGFVNQIFKCIKLYQRVRRIEYRSIGIKTNKFLVAKQELGNQKISLLW